jgi:PleD family two-component response regulator
LPEAGLTGEREFFLKKGKALCFSQRNRSLKFTLAVMPQYFVTTFLLTYNRTQLIVFAFQNTFSSNKMFNTEIKILIVDDLAVMRKIITPQLKQVGFENVIKAINAGVTNYIVKPLSANILENKIYEVFTGKPKATAPA